MQNIWQWVNPGIKINLSAGIAFAKTSATFLLPDTKLTSNLTKFCYTFSVIALPQFSNNPTCVHVGLFENWGKAITEYCISGQKLSGINKWPILLKMDYLLIPDKEHC